MTGGAILSTVQSLEGMFGSQIEAFAASETKALSEALGAGLTDDEIAKSASSERKIIFAGLNSAIAKATNPATAPKVS